MRKIKIVKVNAATSVPGSVEVDGDFTTIFQGKFYRNSIGGILPGYTAPAPAGYSLIVATNFDIVENEKYVGRYTVFSPVGATDLPSSTFSGGKTTIRVNQVVPELVDDEPISLSTDGYVQNISTYLLSTGTSDIIVPPGVTLEQFPVELMGRNVSGWGEGYAQNFVDISRNFAGPVAPDSPFVGLLWYNTTDRLLRIWDGGSWDLVNKTSTQHTQSTPSTTWTVNHGLGLAAPYIAFVQFCVDRGSGPELILPANVSFVSANQLIATFSNPEIGYVLVKA